MNRKDYVIQEINFDVPIPTVEGNRVARTVPIRVLAKVHVKNGTRILTSEALDLIEQTQARYMGLMLPKEMAALRRRLNLTQKGMSKLLQAGEQSYAQWESGKARPSRVVNVLLCAIRDGLLPVAYLQKLCEQGSKMRHKRYAANGSDTLDSPASKSAHRLIPGAFMGRR